MDRASLVSNDRAVEGAVVDALSRAQIPITAVDWSWVPQFETSKLVVVTSLRDSEGPREAYSRVLKALTDADVYKKVPITELFVISPSDPIAKELVRQIKLITEGTLHISNWGDDPDGPFSVVFTPYVGSGGAVPSVKLADKDAVREFLEKRVGIFQPQIDQTINELVSRGSASVFNVQLTLRQVRKLNLAA